MDFTASFSAIIGLGWWDIECFGKCRCECYIRLDIGLAGTHPPGLFDLEMVMQLPHGGTLGKLDKFVERIEPHIKAGPVTLENAQLKIYRFQP
jgi:hypothetical protein